jgi:hypothetical protein
MDQTLRFSSHYSFEINTILGGQCPLENLRGPQVYKSPSNSDNKRKQQQAATASPAEKLKPVFRYMPVFTSPSAVKR